MRIDLYKLALQFSDVEIQKTLDQLNETYDVKIKPDKWGHFLDAMKPKEKAKQLALFE